MTIAKTKSHTQALPTSGIRDNHHRGSVGSFLQGKIQPGSRLSIVSAYFTIYAFEALKAQLTGIEDLQFLFGEPRFVRSLDPDKTDKKSLFEFQKDVDRQQQVTETPEFDLITWLVIKSREEG